MADLAGNTFDKALEIKALNASPQVFVDSVGEPNGSSTDYDDYYRFELTDNGIVNLKLSNLSANTQLYLYDNDGVSILQPYPVTSGTVDKAINRSLRAGTYYIRVSGYSPTTYQLAASVTTLGPIPKDRAGDDWLDAKDLGILGESVITFNDFVGDFNGLSQDDQDYYRFELSEDSLVNLNLSRLSANASLVLYGGDEGNSLGNSFNSGTADETISRILRAGIYYLQVYGGSATTYRIEASAKSAEIANGGAFNSATDLGVVDEDLQSTESVLNGENYVDY